MRRTGNLGSYRYRDAPGRDGDRFEVGVSPCTIDQVYDAAGGVPTMSEMLTHQG